MTATNDVIEMTIRLPYGTVLSVGIYEALRDIRLDPSGAVIIPLDLGNGYRMTKPAPCGTWKLVTS